MWLEALAEQIDSVVATTYQPFIPFKFKVNGIITSLPACPSNKNPYCSLATVDSTNRMAMFTGLDAMARAEAGTRTDRRLRIYVVYRTFARTATGYEAAFSPVRALCGNTFIVLSAKPPWADDEFLDWDYMAAVVAHEASHLMNYTV